MPVSQTQKSYEEVAVIRDAEGIIAVISQRVGGPPHFALAIFKEFWRRSAAGVNLEDKPTRVLWWEPTLADAVSRVIPLAIKRIGELRANAVAQEHGAQLARGAR